MEPVPAYLLVYLWKIRKHSGEIGYFKRRLESEDIERAVYEKSMLRELYDLHLIALTEGKDELVFEPLKLEYAPGKWMMRTGTEHSTTVPRGFVMLARGHYIVFELAASAARWILAALVGGLIALAING